MGKRWSFIFALYFGMAHAEVQYFHSDHLGSTAVVSNSSGAVQQIECYTPFGESVSGSRSTSHASSFTYTNQEFDRESTLYAYGARYYDAAFSRFVSVDPARDGLNVYAYVGGNPISRTDPTGMYFKVDTGNPEVDVAIWDKITAILDDDEHPYYPGVSALNNRSEGVFIGSQSQITEGYLDSIVMHFIDPEAMGDYVNFRPLNATLILLRTLEIINAKLGYESTEEGINRELDGLEKTVLNLANGMPDGIFFSSSLVEGDEGKTFATIGAAFDAALGSFLAAQKEGKVTGNGALADKYSYELIGGLLASPGGVTKYLQDPGPQHRQTVLNYWHGNPETGDQMGSYAGFKQRGEQLPPFLQWMVRHDLIPDAAQK